MQYQDLSPRQLECFYFAIRGFSAKMIAEKVNVSPRTVEAHLQAIKSKLGFLRKSQLLEYGQQFLSETLLT